METVYGHQELSRSEVDTWSGPAVLEFGTDGCGHCQAAQGPVGEVLSALDIEHRKVEDGPGRPLGRSFKVKLWPTFIFLKDGAEIHRVIRPRQASDLRAGLEQILS